MTDYSDVTDVTIEVNTGGALQADRQVEFIHIEDATEWEQDFSVDLYVYAFEDECDGMTLNDTLDDLREEYIFATGVIWPEWLRNEMPLETEVMESLMFVVMMAPEVHPEHLEYLEEFHGVNE